MSAGSVALHLLANLDVDVEELADAAVEADGLAFVQVTFTVLVGDAFLRAGFGQTVAVSRILAFLFISFLRAFHSLPLFVGVGVGIAYRLNMSVTISTSVSAAEIFSAEDILGGPPKRKDILAGDVCMNSWIQEGMVKQEWAEVRSESGATLKPSPPWAFSFLPPLDFSLFLLCTQLCPYNVFELPSLGFTVDFG